MDTTIVLNVRTFILGRMCSLISELKFVSEGNNLIIITIVRSLIREAIALY